MAFKVDNIEISIKQKGCSVILKTDADSIILLENQFTNDRIKIINKNYEIVKAHFNSRVEPEVNLIDFKQVCLRIVFYYLYMYNSWKNSYKREKDRDLTFLSKDFDHPQTKDIIIQFFREQYPESYAEKCEVMLEMSSEKFKTYYKNRQDFYNMF